MGYVEEKPSHFIPEWDGSTECVNKYNKILNGEYLACEIIEANDIGALIVITKQDEDIFKRGLFDNEATRSICQPQFSGYTTSKTFDLYLRGTDNHKDHCSMCVYKDFLLMFVEEILRLNELAEESKKGGESI